MFDNTPRCGRPVLGPALVVAPDGDLDLLQHVRLRAHLVQAAPADDGGVPAGVLLAAGRQADWPHLPRELHRRVQGQDGDVVIQGAGVEAAVSNDAFHLLLDVTYFARCSDVVVAEADA